MIKISPRILFQMSRTTEVMLIVTVPYVTFKRLSARACCSLHDKHNPVELHTVDNMSLHTGVQ